MFRIRWCASVPKIGRKGRLMMPQLADATNGKGSRFGPRKSIAGRKFLIIPWASGPTAEAIQAACSVFREQVCCRLLERTRETFERFLRDSGRMRRLECRVEQGHPPLVRIAARSLGSASGGKRFEAIVDR